jgi:hypothetical protein
MADDLFKTLSAERSAAGIRTRTKAARDWFIDRIKGIRNVNRRSLLKSGKTTAKPLPGRMYMFFYSPKLKAVLPYYDKFPLILLVDIEPDGFYGLNLHYLNPRTRAKFLDKLLEYTNNKKYDETTRIKLSYDLIKGVSKLREFAPCFKKYLNNHVVSSISNIPFPEWEVAIFLPTEQFVGSSKNQVWSESKKSI